MSHPPAPDQPMVATGAQIADPAPLGLAAFALTTFVLSVANTNIVNIAATPVVFGLALAYGGIAQVIAGIWEFAKGNTFGSTAFCSFGAFWISFWYLNSHTDLSGASVNTADDGVGLFLLAWGIFTLYMTVAASRTSLAVLTVFALLTLTFFALAIGKFNSSQVDWTRLGGWLGIATALAAWYASFAAVTNFTFKRTVLPTGPRG